MNHQGTKRMETERLILRPFTEKDACGMYENWASDPEVVRYLPWPAHDSVETTRQLLEEWVREYRQPDRYVWCLEDKESGEPIGSLGALEVDHKVQSVKAGYCLSRRFWYQGLVAEALSTVVVYLLEEVGVERIEARHDARNPRSGAVLKKCGFQYEGTCRRAGWNNSGIYDVCLYGLIKKEKEQAEEGLRQAVDTHCPQSLISDKTIEYVGNLAQLELSFQEKEQAKKDMGRMLHYFDKLKEVNTEGVSPMSHLCSKQNVFRQDVVTDGSAKEEILKNAPLEKNGFFQVPKTIEAPPEASDEPEEKKSPLREDALQEDIL